MIKGIRFHKLSGNVSANGTWTSFNTVANYSLGGTLEYKEILCKGHTLRLRQRGPIKRVQIYIGALASFTLHGLYVKTWTRQPTGLYDLTSTTENLRSALSASGVNTLDLSEESEGALEADYYSVALYGLKTGVGDLLATTAGTTKSRGYVASAVPAETGFNWEGQANLGGGNNFIEVKLWTAGPEMVGIGDSWMSGQNTNRSFIENIDESVDVANTRMEDTFLYWWSQYHGHHYTQNMGIGGNTSSSIQARFAVDAIGRDPQCILLNCPGRNDVMASIPQATSLSNLDNMLDQCEAADIPAVILMPGPWGLPDGSNAENITLDALIAACRATIDAHPARTYVVEIREDIATARVGGTPGNLWDFAPGMDAGDGLHPSPLAYQTIGRSIAETIADEKLVIRQ